MLTLSVPPACTAYTRYVLDIGQSEDWFALQIALMPCLIGYGHIARRLYDDQKTKREGNTYWNWVEQYVAEDYTDAVKAGLDIIERHAVLQSPSRIEQLVQIFIHATKVSLPLLALISNVYAERLGTDGDGILGHGHSVVGTTHF